MSRCCAKPPHGAMAQPSSTSGEHEEVSRASYPRRWAIHWLYDHCRLRVSPMLHLRTSGDPSQPTVVLLHGIGTSGWMWENLFARLNGLHCIAIDMPGHGKSRLIPWISMEDTADRVA